MVPGQTSTSMLLRYGSGSTQPMNKLISTWKVSRNFNERFIMPKCTTPHMVHNPSTPHGLSRKFHSFWRGPYEFTQVLREMTFKTCDIETNKKLIVQIDRRKICRSTPGGFVPTTSNLPHQWNQTFQFSRSKVSFFSFWRWFNLYSNKWPRSCLRLLPNSWKDTAHYLCIATGWMPTPTLLRPLASRKNHFQLTLYLLLHHHVRQHFLQYAVFTRPLSSITQQHSQSKACHCSTKSQKNPTWTKEWIRIWNDARRGFQRPIYLNNAVCSRNSCMQPSKLPPKFIFVPSENAIVPKAVVSSRQTKHTQRDTQKWKSSLRYHRHN